MSTKSNQVCLTTNKLKQAIQTQLYSTKTDFCSTAQIGSSSLEFPRGACEASKRSVFDIHEHCEQTRNKAENQNAKSLSTQLAVILQNATTTTVLLICGIALPWLAHRFGFGMAFLPMHLPLLIGGFLLPFGYAFFLAVMIPLTNTALIGMPAFFPALPTLVIELTVYVLAIKYFLQIRHNNIFMSLIFALFLGRIATTIVALIFGHIVYTGFSSIALYFNHLIADFLPGLAIQLLIVSLLIPRLLPYFNQNKNK